MRLVSFVLCPFAQRCQIVLSEKQIEHRVQFVDIYDKPPWLLELSPLGKVPLLEVDGEILFESGVINEYLEGIGGAPAMHPVDALGRAKNRMWIEFAGKVSGEAFRVMLAPDRETARHTVQDIRASLGLFEGMFADGPFFGGDAPNLVDAAVAPALQRLAWCEAVEPELNVLQGLPRVASWRDALLARPSVRDGLPADVFDVFVDYLQGRGSPGRRVASSWLGVRARERGLGGGQGPTPATP